MARLIPNAAVADAIAEFQSKTEKDIERETAIKWGARALAAYALFEEHFEAGAYPAAMDWMLRAEDHYHEAMEHAALMFDHGETVRQIQLDIKPIRARAHRWLKR